MTDVAVKKDYTGQFGEETPSRVHHLAYTTYDMAGTRHFYEDILGMPLTQCWIEHTEGRDGRSPATYAHCFFTNKDGSAIAYFEFLGREKPDPLPHINGFHIAFKVDKETQDGIKQRLDENGHTYAIGDHGYCLSLYVTDLNGLELEFTNDHPDIANIAARQLDACHNELDRWLSGDHSPNNTLRPH